MEEDEKRPRTQVRTRPFKPTCCMSIYKADYDKLVDYAYAKQVTLRQAFSDAVSSLSAVDGKKKLFKKSKTAEKNHA